MMNLKLFTDLQGDFTASLLLKPSSPGNLQYYVISSTVNHSVVVYGTCAGELPNDSPLSFDVVLSSVAPLLNKNYQFRLSYLNGVLQFVEEGDRFTLAPLCVEHISEYALDAVQRLMKFSEVLNRWEDSQEELEDLELKLTQMRANYEQTKAIELSGFVASTNPWSDSPFIPEKVDEYYNPKIEELSERIAAAKSRLSDLKIVDFEGLRRISTLAARYGIPISMCDDFALLDLTTAFVLQKLDCGVRSVQGKLMKRLLQEQYGKFFVYNGELIFTSSSGKGSDKSQSVVFLSSYLPNTTVDSTIVTNGAVLEKYRINLKGMLAVVSAVSSKFDTMVFNMGASRLELSNDRGEQLIYRFDVEDAKTVELNKLLRGERAGDIVMSSIEIPRVVQTLLPLLENQFTIYVKERKIILQSDTLYVIFGR